MTKKLYKVTCTSQTYTHYWVRADNKKDAEENYADGNEISWEQIESEVLTTVERKEDYWRKA